MTNGSTQARLPETRSSGTAGRAFLTASSSNKPVSTAVASDLFAAVVGSFRLISSYFNPSDDFN